MPELISVVGGECTGKSTLAAALATRLPAVVAPETLRDWVDQQGRVPRADEQAAVMTAHRESEIAALRRAENIGLGWAISDSGPLMTAVYSIQYYDDDSLLERALEWTAKSRRVVWCQDDFSWSPDPQREGTDARATSQQILRTIFAEHPELPALTVRGALHERVETVVCELNSG